MGIIIGRNFLYIPDSNRIIRIFRGEAYIQKAVRYVESMVVLCCSVIEPFRGPAVGFEILFSSTHFNEIGLSVNGLIISCSL